ncbi:LysR substrate-binding domain-containing protein [Pseudomonas peli]|uniref:LysR substrate-binding domain-containing protein n=1 Tax=Pseudomonas peli TaxID=592361 RepID=UPI003D15B36B
MLGSLRRFRETYPNVQLTIREMPSASQAKALLAGEADIGFMRRLPLPAGTLEHGCCLMNRSSWPPASHAKAQQGKSTSRVCR